MRVFYLGFPGAMGGANTEMLHTIAVWRLSGIDVTLVPTWNKAEGPMMAKMQGIGCEIAQATPATIGQVPGIAGSIVHSMCNSHFWEVFGTLKKLGCKTVWSSCMTFEFPETLAAYKAHGPCDAYHFQSEFQRQEVTATLAKLGIAVTSGRCPVVSSQWSVVSGPLSVVSGQLQRTTDNGQRTASPPRPLATLIRGAFDFTDYPFAPRPHGPDEEFFVGRLSRPDQDKWSSNLWPILTAVPYPQRRALAMGWTLALNRKCGQPPKWAQTFTPQQIPVPEFLSRCHAMIGLNGGARENWPRIGLEAMAAGVPLVVQNLWGWREMIVHGETGFLCDNDQDFAFYLALLARDEGLRLRIADNARSAVERMANPMIIGQQWRTLFESLKPESVPESVPEAA
jgi:hypothetical protein